MSFFAKGDFKIEESWDSKSGDKKSTSRSGSRNNSRNQGKPEVSLMHQLAANYAEPTTDIIDDSLSRLLMKERGGVPTPARKQVGTKKPPQPHSRSKKQPEEDKDLLASMASRLQKLQKTCQSQRLQIKDQKEQVEKVKTENAFLKSMREDSNKVFDQMNQIKKNNSELQTKVNQMEAYLQQYGMKWVGNKIEGSLNSQKMKKDIKDAKHAYRLPSQIDLATIQRRVLDLNVGLESQGMGTQIYNEKGVHKFRKTEYLPMAFYSNGIVIKGFNFFPYKSKESLRILADLVDGYFPFVFKAKFPNGVLLQVVDKVQQAYIQQKKETSINTLGTTDQKDFQPQSKEQFLNKLPKQVMKNGKVIQIRGEFEKMFDPSIPGVKETKHIEEVDGVMMITTVCYRKVQNKEMSEEEVCSLKVRDEGGSVYMMKMAKDSKIINVIVELRKVVRSEFKIMSNYPRRSYDQMEAETLEELGFYPGVNLHLQK